MASGPITSWQIDGKTVETVADFIFLGSKITAYGDCSNEIKRHLLLGRKVMTNCQGTFNFKGSNMFFFVCCFSRTLYSLSVPGKQEWAELHALLRTEIMKRAPAWIPFSDSLQWPFQLCPSYSGYWMLSGPLKIVIRLALFFAQFFLLAKACISTNKAPLFHSRLGSPASLFLSTPVPMSQSTKTMTTNLDSILKSRDITLSTKVHLVKAMVFPVVMYGCESWTIKKAEHWRIDAF